ncbi:oligosaccharyl transferase, archaeosortase A system-associated [Methanolobus zinderi]|uniref:oligosaccharyl transferase, archaeosortase A system-associated n=1 Tax=Methanolobus zinderi TaxID=536044 RepID=UPI0031B626D4
MITMVDRNKLFSKTILLPLLVLFSFLLRSVSLSGIVTEGRFMFVGTDAFYHMRRVLYITENFPSSFTFDSYLNYPSGFELGWPPLYDQAIALLALVLGLGNPDTGTIEFAGAIFPALLGALTLIPLYYAASAVFDKRTALISAAILSLIPINLSVTMAGATDHHVAEIFLSTTAYAFFLQALKYGGKANLSISDIRTKGKELLNRSDPSGKAMLLSAGSGFVLAIAVFTWLGSPIFIGLIGLFVFAQLTASLKQERFSEHALIISVTALLTALVIVIPFIATVVRPGMEFSGMFLSWFHAAYIAAIIIGILVLGILAGYVVSKKLNWYYYPLIVAVLTGVGIVILRFLSPQFYDNTMGGVLYLLGDATAVLGTISEAMPLFYDNGFTLEPLWKTLFIFSITGIIGLVLSILKLHRDRYMPEMVFFMIWSLVVIVLTISQRRFAYLLAVNVAMLSGFFINMAYVSLAGSRTGYRTTKPASGKKKSKSGKSASRAANTSASVKEPTGAMLEGTTTPVLLAILVLILSFVLFTPVYSLVSHPGVPDYDWQESLIWLGANSPETSHYLDPSSEPEYGVMSWWDYGNWILYISKRPVVANNFQTGLEASSRFFATADESESNSILDGNNVKYVVTDNKMYATKSSAIFSIAGEEYMMGQNFDSFYNSLDMRKTTIAKLHILDGSHLGRLRLVHESPNSQMSLVFNEDEEEGTPIKNVKVFEYVAGAKIYGSAEPGDPVYARVRVTSNQNRQFIYENMAIADESGYYEMRVPYSTNGDIPEISTDPNFVVFLENATVVRETAVSEEDVMQGNEIQVDLV